MSKSNEPAYPTESSIDGFLRMTGGMTKRELIAKDCLAGMMDSYLKSNLTWTDQSKLAKLSVQFADALLEALE